MVLNIFPRKKETPPAPAPEPAAALPEPSPAALAALEPEAPGDGSGEPRRRATRRGSRGRGRSRGVSPEGETSAEPIAPAEEPAAEPPPAPARRPRRGSARATAEAAAEAVSVPAQPEETPEAPKRPRRAPAKARAAEPEPDTAGGADTAAGGGVLRALEQQRRQIDRLVALQEESSRRLSSPGAGFASVGTLPRVGIFVDAANIELALERQRGGRVDWAKVLRLLTENRQLVRAIAYSPVHDDPGVSIETQRFVEPFLDKGYKVVTKALKRFQDGTIKANVDIELALDVVSMLDRLDVVCLVSGDGDFVRLVEMAQSRGVRVEVVSVGGSTAGNLRQAADAFIDLHTRLREVRA